MIQIKQLLIFISQTKPWMYSTEFNKNTWNETIQPIDVSTKKGNTQSISTSDLFSDISVICSHSILNLDLLWHMLGLGSFSFQRVESDRGIKPSNPDLSIFTKLNLSKNQTYLVSLPHLLGMSCHSWAGSWPWVAPLCSALQASLRYFLSVIHILISSLHTVR